MRRILENLSILALAALVFIPVNALYGPNPIPARIPMHFDVTGRPNGWGPSRSLWGLVFGGLVMYAVLTLVSRYPTAFNYPVKVTDENRPRLQALSLELLSWMKLEVLGLFSAIQYLIVTGARSASLPLPAAFLPVTLGVVFGTVGVYIVRFRRAAC
jgi:uncharacterized membrane protein